MDLFQAFQRESSQQKHPAMVGAVFRLYRQVSLREETLVVARGVTYMGPGIVDLLLSPDERAVY